MTALEEVRQLVQEVNDEVGSPDIQEYIDEEELGLACDLLLQVVTPHSGADEKVRIARRIWNE